MGQTAAGMARKTLERQWPLRELEILELPYNTVEEGMRSLRKVGELK